MPSCCVRGCGARKDINHPQLTLHKFPRNEVLRKKWLDVIGIDNINPRHKVLHVCSLHFAETCFNRTLTVMRLRDDSVPSLTPIQQHGNSSDDIISPVQDVFLVPTEDHSYAAENVNEPQQNALDRAQQLIRQQTDEIFKLKQKCIKLQKKVKTLTERVRRRDKKITVFSDMDQRCKRSKFYKHARNNAQD